MRFRIIAGWMLPMLFAAAPAADAFVATSNIHVDQFGYTMLVRGIGPTLAGQGVPDAPGDPRIEPYRSFNGSSTRIASDDDWGGGNSLAAAFSATGAFGLSAGSKDAPLLITVQPGLYSAVVSGVGGATGAALVEVYEVP
jgi:hypothetical protein